MPNNSSLTLRIDQELKDRLESLSQNTNRSKSYLAAQAIEQYVDKNSWQIEKIKAAVEHADSGGKFIKHDAMGDWLQSWGTDHEQEPPKTSELVNKSNP